MQDQPADRSHRIGRRAFLQRGTLFLAGSAVLAHDLRAAEQRPKLRIGLVTDLHYADKPTAGTRHYRESAAKAAEAIRQFKDVALVVCLGDLIDTGASLDAEKGHLRRIVKEFAAASGRRHFVLGNHCVENLTKAEFLEIVGQEKSYYSFDAGGYHVVVLDACFTGDGTPYGRKNFTWSDAMLPQAELEWLAADLGKSPHKSLVFVHQCLDVIPPYGVKNAGEVRKILEASGKVLAVVQGHYHAGSYREVGGLHYCTLSAMVNGEAPESNSYTTLELLPGDSIRITGFRKQKSYRWS